MQRDERARLNSLVIEDAKRNWIENANGRTQRMSRTRDECCDTTPERFLFLAVFPSRTLSANRCEEELVLVGAGEVRTRFTSIPYIRAFNRMRRSSRFTMLRAIASISFFLLSKVIPYFGVFYDDISASSYRVIKRQDRRVLATRISIWSVSSDREESRNENVDRITVSLRAITYKTTKDGRDTKNPEW